MEPFEPALTGALDDLVLGKNNCKVSSNKIVPTVVQCNFITNVTLEWLFSNLTLKLKMFFEEIFPY